MAQPFTAGRFQALDNYGFVVPGGLLYSYAAGTLTPLATYTNQLGTLPNTNPVVLDNSGKADVWLGPATYRLVLKTAAGATIWDVDNVATQFDASQFGNPNLDSFTADGTTTVYNLSKNPGLLNNLEVFVGGVRQINGVDFTWTAPTTLTSTTAWPASASVIVKYTLSSPVGYLSGSSVNLSQYGTGVVARNVEDKLRDFVTIRDFGAVGNGVTDDTAAVQAFFNYCTVNGRRGFIQPGQYVISSKITVTVGSLGWTIEGAGSEGVGFRPSTTFSGGTIAFQVLGSNVACGWKLGGFKVQPIGATSGTATVGIQIGDPTVTNAIGISGYQFSNIADVQVASFATAWQITHARMIRFTGCSGWNLQGTQNTVLSITQTGAFTGDLRFEGCQFVTTNANSNLTLSINSSAGPYSSVTGFGSIAGIKFSACDFYSGTKAISIFANSVSVVADIWFVNGCQVDQQTVNAVYVESQNSGTLIENLHFTGLTAAKSTSSQMSFTSTGTFGTIKSPFIEGCNLIGPAAEAIKFSGTGCISPQVNGNIIVDCANTGAAILFGSTTNPTAIGNKCRTGVLTQRPYYLFQLDSGTTNITVCNNDGLGGVNISTILDNSGDVLKVITGNGGYNPLPNTSITVGSSPFTYKNTTGSTQTVYVNAGTVSNITLGGNQVASGTNTVVTVPQGASMVVTYSSTPTMSRTGH